MDNRVIDQTGGLAAVTDMPKPGRQIETVAARPTRILPWFLIVASVGGLWDQARGGEWGFGVVTMAFCATNFVQIFGPFRQSGLFPWRDEREADLFRRGHLIGLAATMAATVIGCFYCGSVLLHGYKLWLPAKPFDWHCLAFFLVVLEGNVAALAASRDWPSEVAEIE